MSLPNVVAPLGGPWCWKCMRTVVPRPLELCIRCARSTDEAQKKRAARERTTETHERTHEKQREDLGTDKLDLAAYRRWLDLTDT